MRLRAACLMLLVLAAAAAAADPPAVEPAQAPTNPLPSGCGPRARASSRSPLAFQSGDLAPPATVRDGADVLERGHRPDELILTTPPDSLLAALMDSTSLVNVTATIERLQAFYTRYVGTDSCAASGEWIRERFVEYGLEDVELDTFRCWSYQDTVDAVNVVARKEGTTRPDEYVVIGGHYDSITTDNFSDPGAYAPGADDNASGVAGVLEAARLLADMELERSVLFACWSGEEVGLWGSRAWVADAADAGLDIVVYMNMDVISYTDEAMPTTIVYADSLSLSLAGFLCELIVDNTPYGCITRVQPIGASDHNSFWEAGYNVLDTSSGDGWSPYHHTPEDVIENCDLPLARAIAAANVAGAAAIAGVVGAEPNLPPETTLAETCASLTDTLGPAVTFEWSGVDFDGGLSAFEYRLTDGESGDWTELSPTETSLHLSGLQNGPATFEVRAVDTSGARDPSPAAHAFVVVSDIAPELTVAAPFVRDTLRFKGGASPPDSTVRVFEGERLVFTLAASADDYCGTVTEVAVAVNDGPWDHTTPPSEFVVTPAAGDTAIRFRASDGTGGRTTGHIAIEVVPFGQDLPLLVIDDWFGGDVPEEAHDAYYDTLLTWHEHDVWDPFEEMAGGGPAVPPMEELGRYRTVIWTLGPVAPFLQGVQSRPGYSRVEGHVRAGGNLIVEGFSSVTRLAALDQFENGATFGPGDFLYDAAAIDSVWNTGSLTNPSTPEVYGYAFLGALTTEPWAFPSLALDTLGTWYEGYVQYGGLPDCEVYRTRPAAHRIYLFDAFINTSLQDMPTGVVRYSDDAEGSVALLGFPLYYVTTAPTLDALDTLLESLEDWQEPAELFSFYTSAAPDSVGLTWRLEPVDSPQGSILEREVDGTFAALHDGLLEPDLDGTYRFADETAIGGRTETYRLRVVERWGGQTVHGPWEVAVPLGDAVDRLVPARPNPTSGAVQFACVVTVDGGWLDVAVYSVDGRLVRRLVDGPVDAGYHEISWDGRDASGREAASGVYFTRAVIRGSPHERKFVLLR